MIQLPDGRSLSGHFLPHLFNDIPGIERFQVVQDAIDHITIDAVTTGMFDPRAEQLVLSKVAAALPGLKAELRQVDEIPLTKTGKHRTTVNRVNTANNPASLEESS